MLSDFERGVCTVPQGSILEPLLYIILKDKRPIYLRNCMSKPTNNVKGFDTRTVCTRLDAESIFQCIFINAVWETKGRSNETT